jgi:hypothetical protein
VAANKPFMKVTMFPVWEMGLFCEMPTNTNLGIQSEALLGQWIMTA